MNEEPITWPVLAPGPLTVEIDASFEALIPKFLKNRQTELQTMTAAASAGDHDTVRKVAHGIKGAGGTYGFHDLSAIGAGLEQAGKRSDASAIEVGLRALADYLSRVQVVYAEDECDEGAA